MKIPVYFNKLQSESWNYLAVLLGLCILTLFAATDVVTRAYNIGMDISAPKPVNIQPPAAVASMAVPANQSTIFGEHAAPVVNSNFVLKGIEYSGDTSIAIIASSNGEDKLYHTGDKLAEGVTVQSIAPGQVVILNNGRREILLVVWKGGEGETPVATGLPQQQYNQINQFYNQLYRRPGMPAMPLIPGFIRRQTGMPQ